MSGGPMGELQASIDTHLPRGNSTASHRYQPSRSSSVRLSAALLLTWSAITCSVFASPEEIVGQARKTDTVDRTFGFVMPDPYRWMEGEGNQEFAAWIAAQGTASRAKLDALPTLSAWRERLATTATAGTRHGGHQLEGERLFFLRAHAGGEAALILRDARGNEHTIFDARSQPGASISGYTIAPGGRRVAVNITRGGDEAGELTVFDTSTGKALETLKPVWSEFNAQWMADGKSYAYTRMRTEGDGDPLLGTSTYLHSVGDPTSSDVLLARAGDTDSLKIAANDFPVVYFPHGSDWAVLRIGGARPSFRVCVAPSSRLGAGKPGWRCLVDDKDAVQGLDVRGDTLYLLQAGGRPNRHLLAINLRKSDMTAATAPELVAERPDAVLSEVGVARDALYLKVMRGGFDSIERVDYTSGALQPLPMRGGGSISLMRTDPSQDGVLLSFEDWTTPRKVYRYTSSTSKVVDIGLGDLGEREYPDLIVEETDALSRDGTKVPLSLIHRKDMPRHDSARAIVVGYGGYGISMQPVFRPDSLEWANAGNVYAICHVRGGGENGDAWRTGGSGPNKQRGIEDFIACAKELTARGLTTPTLTAGFSGSMGGLLAGGAYTTSPEAWGAMVVQSGLFNPTRILSLNNGRNQIAEVGDPRTPAGMGQLFAMDPYLHVKDGVAYPPLLLIVGLVDKRAPASQSGKFGARVKAASARTSVLFRTEAAFGHVATNSSARALEMADIFAFLDAFLK